MNKLQTVIDELIELKNKAKAAGFEAVDNVDDRGVEYARAGEA